MNGTGYKARGFIFSLSTILVLIVVVWFSSFYSEKVERDETAALESFGIQKAGFVGDDITADVNRLLGAGLDVNRGPDFVTLKINDKMGSDKNRQQLRDYQDFVDGTYALRQKAEIQLGLAKLLDGATEIVFSNGLEYVHAYDSDLNFVQFWKRGGSTQALTYDINLFVEGATLETAAPWACGAAGDVNVSVRYKDSSGETEQTLGCMQDGTDSYEYEFGFVDLGGSVKVLFGSVDGNLNAVRVRNTVESPGVEVFTSIGAVLVSPAEELSWYYDADLNYTQDEVRLNRKLLLGKA